MGSLSDLGLTAEELRRAIRGDDASEDPGVPAAPEAGRGPRRPGAPWGGDPKVEAVLGEGARRLLDGAERELTRARHGRKVAETVCSCSPGGGGHCDDDGCHGPYGLPAMWDRAVQRGEQAVERARQAVPTVRSTRRNRRRGSTLMELLEHSDDPRAATFLELPEARTVDTDARRELGERK